MLSLPDELILEILQKYSQQGRPKFKSTRSDSPNNPESFNNPTHNFIASNITNLNRLHQFCMVCKRLYRIVMPALYQRVILNHADSIYLLLRTLIDNPDLVRYVLEVRLNGRNDIQENHTFRRYGAVGTRAVGRVNNAKGANDEEKELKKIMERKGGSRKGLYELPLSPLDVQQLSTYAQKCGLNESCVRSLQNGDRNFGEITSILLIISLPSVESIQIDQEGTNKYKVFDSLLLEFIQNSQLPKISNRLAEFKRITEIDSGTEITNLVPTILIPSIRTLTIVGAGIYLSDMNEYPESLDFHNLIDTYSASSSVESIYIHDCLIHEINLDLLLKFPRSLRLLSLIPSRRFNSYFSFIRDALTNARPNVLDSLVTLHIGRGDWRTTGYNPSEFFQLFARLERLAIPVELLLVNGTERLGDWGSFFPLTLLHLTLYTLESYMNPDFNHLYPLIEEQTESRRRGEGRIRDIGADSWADFDLQKLVTLISRSEEVGIRLAQVKDSEKPFDYNRLELEE